MPPDEHENYLKREYQIWIYELKDEWFIVWYQSKNISGSQSWNQTRGITFQHYKCDQIGGLIKLFQELGILNE